MPRDKSDVEKGLQRKGFVPNNKKKADHNYFIYLSIDGKKALVGTHTSHGKGFDIGDNLLAQMARQCGINKPLFMRLLDCNLSREAYERELRIAGKL